MNRPSLVLAVASLVMFLLLASMASAYTITASIAGSGAGTITPPGTVTGTDGTSRTFFVSTAAGSRLVKLTVNSVEVWDCFEEDGEEWCYVPGSYTFNNTMGTNTIVATFESMLPPPPLAVHNITATAGANGSISPAGTVPVGEGKNQLFVISPNPGYKIASLTLDAGTAGEMAVEQECDEESGACGLPNTYTFTNVTGSHSLAATFAPTAPAAIPPHTITLNAGPGGALNPPGEGIPKKISVADGQSQTFLVLPDSGFKIASLTVDKGTPQETVVQECEDEIDLCWVPSSYAFTQVTADHTLDVTFEQSGPADPGLLTYHTISIQADPGGSTSPSGEAAQPGDPRTVSVLDGQSQTFVILPESGYRIASLTVDGGAVEDCLEEEDGYFECWTPNSYVFPNVTGDHSIEVAFEPTGAADPGLLTYHGIEVTVGAGGSINPPGVADPADAGAPKTVSVVDGGDQMFYINPAPGYRIATLVVDGTPVPPVEDDESGASALPNTYTFMAVADSTHSLEVTFEPTISAPPTIRTISASATPAEGGFINPSGVVPVIDGQDQVFLLSPYPGCELLSLAVNGSPVQLQEVCDEDSGACAMPNSYTFTNVGAGPNSIVATFTPPPATFEVTAGVVDDLGDGVGGTISYAGSKAWDEGAQPTYFFFPTAGFKVAEVCVDGNCLGPMSSYTFAPLAADVSITVEFEAVPITYTITASSGTGGTIDPPGTSYVSYNGSLTYYFFPKPYYEVADVKVNNVSLGPLDSYLFENVQKNQKISVSFVRPVYTVTTSVEAGNGSISYLGDKLVYAGTNLTYTVKPAAGSTLDQVTVNDIPVTVTKNKFTLTAIDGDWEVKAYFK